MWAQTVETVVYHINALTGEDVVADGEVMFLGAATGTFFVDQPVKYAILVDEGKQVCSSPLPHLALP